MNEQCRFLQRPNAELLNRKWKLRCVRDLTIRPNDPAPQNQCSIMMLPNTSMFYSGIINSTSRDECRKNKNMSTKSSGPPKSPDYYSKYQKFADKGHKTNPRTKSNASGSVHSSESGRSSQYSSRSSGDSSRESGNSSVAFSQDEEAGSSFRESALARSELDAKDTQSKASKSMSMKSGGSRATGTANNKSTMGSQANKSVAFGKATVMSSKSASFKGSASSSKGFGSRSGSKRDNSGSPSGTQSYGGKASGFGSGQNKSAASRDYMSIDDSTILSKSGQSKSGSTKSGKSAGGRGKSELQFAMPITDSADVEGTDENENQVVQMSNKPNPLFRKTRHKAYKYPPRKPLATCREPPVVIWNPYIDGVDRASIDVPDKDQFKHSNTKISNVDPRKRNEIGDVKDPDKYTRTGYTIASRDSDSDGEGSDRTSYYEDHPSEFRSDIKVSQEGYPNRKSGSRNSKFGYSSQSSSGGSGGSNELYSAVDNIRSGKGTQKDVDVVKRSIDTNERTSSALRDLIRESEGGDRGTGSGNSRSRRFGTSMGNGESFAGSGMTRGSLDEEEDSDYENERGSRGFSSGQGSRGYGSGMDSREFSNSQGSRGYGSGMDSRGFSNSQGSRVYGSGMDSRGFSNRQGSRGYGNDRGSRGFGSGQNSRFYDNGMGSRGYSAGMSRDGDMGSTGYGSGREAMDCRCGMGEGYRSSNGGRGMGSGRYGMSGGVSRNTPSVRRVYDDENGMSWYHFNYSKQYAGRDDDFYGSGDGIKGDGVNTGCQCNLSARQAAGDRCQCCDCSTQVSDNRNINSARDSDVCCPCTCQSFQKNSSESQTGSCFCDSSPRSQNPYGSTNFPSRSIMRRSTSMGTSTEFGMNEDDDCCSANECTDVCALGSNSASNPPVRSSRQSRVTFQDSRRSQGYSSAPNITLEHEGGERELIYRRSTQSSSAYNNATFPTRQGQYGPRYMPDSAIKTSSANQSLWVNRPPQCQQWSQSTRRSIQGQQQSGRCHCGNNLSNRASGFGTRNEIAVRESVDEICDCGTQTKASLSQVQQSELNKAEECNCPICCCYSCPAGNTPDQNSRLQGGICRNTDAGYNRGSLANQQGETKQCCCFNCGGSSRLQSCISPRQQQNSNSTSRGGCCHCDNNSQVKSNNANTCYHSGNTVSPRPQPMSAQGRRGQGCPCGSNFSPRSCNCVGQQRKVNRGQCCCGNTPRSCVCDGNVNSYNSKIGGNDQELPWYKQCPKQNQSSLSNCGTTTGNDKCCRCPIRAEEPRLFDRPCKLSSNTPCRCTETEPRKSFGTPLFYNQNVQDRCKCCGTNTEQAVNACNVGEIDSFVKKFESPFFKGGDWSKSIRRDYPGVLKGNEGSCCGSRGVLGVASMTVTEIMSLRRMLPIERRSYYRSHQMML